MKLNKARVLAIGAAAFMAATTAMPAVPTFAAVQYGTGKITINKTDANDDKKDNSSVTYTLFQIFKANVKDDKSDAAKGTGKTETNIAWANDAVKTAVENVIKNVDKSYSGTTAQDAADFIVANITGTNNTTRVDANTFADNLAHAVAGLTTTTTLRPGQQSGDLGEGYWLITTDKSTTDSKQDITGTAPIFALIGGTSPVSVTEKTSTPMVQKDVKNDATNATLQHALAVDSEMNQDLDYELTGTIADNIQTYDTYKYTFTDTLPAGMTASDIHVYAENGGTKTELLNATQATDKTTGYVLSNPATGTQNLVIDFQNLKNAKVSATGNAAATINGKTKIIVDYKAKIDPNKANKIVYGGKGNQNTVKLTYSNNPYSNGVGESTPKTTTDYTYKLKLHKVDRTTEKNLAGAKFTIQATGADEGTTDQYVQEDGTLGATAYKFTTDDNGEINVTGLDAGTYKVVETDAPTGYDNDLKDGFTFQIKPTYDGEKLTSLENVLQATDSVIAGSTDGDTTDNVLKSGNKGDGANPNTGEVLITMGDNKRIALPLTGQSGIAVMLGLGAGVFAVSFAAYEKNKKKEKAEA